MTTSFCRRTSTAPALAAAALLLLLLPAAPVRGVPLPSPLSAPSTSDSLTEALPDQVQTELNALPAAKRAAALTRIGSFLARGGQRSRALAAERGLHLDAYGDLIFVDDKLEDNAAADLEGQRLRREAQEEAARDGAHARKRRAFSDNAPSGYESNGTPYGRALRGKQRRDVPVTHSSLPLAA